MDEESPGLNLEKLVDLGFLKFRVNNTVMSSLSPILWMWINCQRLPLKIPRKQWKLPYEDDGRAAEADGMLLYEPDSFFSHFL